MTRQRMKTDSPDQPSGHHYVADPYRPTIFCSQGLVRQVRIFIFVAFRLQLNLSVLIVVGISTWPMASAQDGVQPFSHPGVTALAFSLKGDVLASGGRENIRLWDVGSGKLLKTLPSYNRRKMDGSRWSGRVTGLAFLAKDLLLSSSKDGNLFIWDLRTGQLRRSIAEPWVRRIAINPNPLALRRLPIDGMDVSKDRRHVAACVFGTVQVWDLKTGKLHQSFGAEGLRTQTLEVRDLVPADKKDAASKWTQAYLAEFLTFPIESVKPTRLKRWRTVSPVLDDLPSVQFSADHKNIAASGAHATYVWDFRSGELRFVVKNASYSCFSPDSRILVTGCWFGPLQVWNVTSGRQVKTLPERSWAVQFSANGRFFLSNDSELIWRWNVESWKKERSFPINSPGGSPEFFAVSPNSKLLAARWKGWDERRIRVWPLTVNDKRNVR